MGYRSLMVGQRLGEHRKQLDLTLEKVAELARLSPNRVAQIENGQVPFLDELMALANALGADPAVLASSGRRPTSAVRFRTAGAAHELSSMDARLLARGAEAGRVCAALLKMTGKPTSVLSKHREVKALDSRIPWKQGYTVGADARKKLAPEPVPIPSVQALLESLGVHVAFVSFESSQIEAASLYEAGASPVILLNADEPRRRVQRRLSRRAILAHELCHLLHDGGQPDLTMVSRHDEVGEAVEQRANGFAPSFIAPRGWVRVTASEPVDIAVEVGQTWGLSYDGAVWHSKNLGLITAAQADAIMARQHKVRPEDFETDVRRTTWETAPSPLASGLLSDVAIAAFEGGAISRGRLDEILLIA